MHDDDNKEFNKKIYLKWWNYKTKDANSKLRHEGGMRIYNFHPYKVNIKKIRYRVTIYRMRNNSLVPTYACILK